MIVLFWILFGLLFLIYFGYPIVTIIIATFRSRPDNNLFKSFPRVALIVAAHNEEAVIADKLDNLLKLDYPKEALEIIVASDGSTDRTNQIVESYADRGVRLLRVEPRGGKTHAMNLAIHATDADILVYTDAEPLIERSAIQYLVPYFNDPRVGVVCGNSLYGKGEEHRGAEQESVYWRIENWIKYSESRAYNSLVGGTGDLFAVRRIDADELPDNINHDIMVQVLMRAKGKFVLFEPRALAFSQGSKALTTEYRRKVRIVFQSAYSVFWKSETLNPFKHFTLAYQLWLHKVLRWFSGLWLFPLLPLSYLLRNQSSIPVSIGDFSFNFMVYDFCFWVLAVFYGLAVIGYFAGKVKIRLGPLGMPFYMNMVYIAAIHGIVKLLWERPAPTWRVDRTQEQG